jgi:Carboxypeptidase regulatory-like domain
LAPALSRSWLVLAPAAAVVGLGGLVAARFWFGGTPSPPTFEAPAAPEFPALPTVAERPPGGPTLSGTVVDQEGQPVGDVLVYLRAAGVPMWTTSDAEGRFELAWPALEGGAEAPSLPIEVVVAAWGYSPIAQSVSFGDARIEITLPAPEESTPRVAAVESATVKGRVACALGEDSPSGAEVWLEPVDLGSALGLAVTRRARCAQDGAFEIADLQYGSYRLHVLPGWAAGGSWPDLLDSAQGALEHTGAQTSGLALKLVGGAVHGAALDYEGRPLEGALVLLADADHPERWWPPRVSNADGAFRIADLPTGNYTLVVSAGEARREVTPVAVKAGVELELELPPLSPRGRQR